MATKRTICDKCGSVDITDINPELKENSKMPLVKIKAKCNDCNNEFEYSSATASGKRRGILY